MDKSLSHHMLQMLHLLQQLQSFPLNGRRQRREKPLSTCFCAAESPAISTEMRPMQRMARLVPPPRKGTIAVQQGWAAAEFAVHVR
jgi:hypothetical protein